jgi:hypothetical protein
MPKMSIRTGATYGFWTVLRASAGEGLCVCKCGRKQFVGNRQLARRGTCPKCKFCANRIRAGFTKGIVRSNLRKYESKLTPLVYRMLRRRASLAIRRCHNVTSSQWHNYGGRGISVCKCWRDNPKKFIDYMASLDGHDNPSLYLDRIDNDGNYELGNLRFVTASQSVRNRRCSRLPATV